MNLKTKYGVVEGGRLKSFNVYKGDWYRGHGHEKSGLLMPDGKSCCIGFMAAACGVPRHLLTVSSMLTLHAPSQRAALAMVGVASIDWFDDAYNTNDSLTITDDKLRQSRLQRIFADLDIIINFIDGPTPEGK